MDRSVAGHFVRKLCANAPGSTRASALPGSELQEKTLVRERRLGDLNPGRARTLTALAVLFLSSRPVPVRSCASCAQAVRSGWHLPLSGYAGCSRLRPPL